MASNGAWVVEVAKGQMVELAKQMRKDVADAQNTDVLFVIIENNKQLLVRLVKSTDRPRQRTLPDDGYARTGMLHLRPTRARQGATAGSRICARVQASLSPVPAGNRRHLPHVRQ